MDKKSTFLTGVRLTTDEKEIVEDKMYTSGSLSFSAALRQIIREYAEMKRERNNKESKADNA